MSSHLGSRNTPPSGRYGSDDYFKRKKHPYASSTRRDFKNPGHGGGFGLHQVNPSPSRVLPRTDSSGSDSSSRGRYRDLNSLHKDARYSHEKPSGAGHYKDRDSGAYGSFSAAKRMDSDLYSPQPAPRDQTSRDVVNGSFARGNAGSSRDSWRAERSRYASNGSTSKPFPTSRYGSNGELLQSRAPQGSLPASSANDRHDQYDRYSGRTKPSLSAASRSIVTKERIRSSGLTNSVKSRTGADFYSQGSPSYPHKLSQVASPQLVNTGHQGTPNAGLNDHQMTLNEHAGSDSVEKSSQLGSSIVQQGSMRSDLEDSEDDDDEDEEDEEDVEDEDKMLEDKTSEVNGSTGPDTPEVFTKHHGSGLISEKSPDITSDDRYSPTFSEPPTQVGPGATLQQTTDLSHIDYPTGCLQPLTLLETRYQTSKKDYESKAKASQYQTAHPGDFKRYDFYLFNLKKFVDSQDHLTKIMDQEKRDIRKQQLRLWLEYNEKNKEYETRQKFMTEQLSVLSRLDDDTRRELELIDVRPKATIPAAETPVLESAPQSGRRGRRHGDLVTTEAEFEEILKSLKKEEMEDPVARARQVAAIIPDLIIDDIECQFFRFSNSNNYVHDKASWEERIKLDFDTNFTDREHDLFCEAFCRFPKRFGEISRFMGGLRTAEECVLHYYITKKAMNYKFMVMQHKKKTTKKSAKRKKKAKEIEDAASDLQNNSQLDETPSEVTLDAAVADTSVIEAAEEFRAEEEEPLKKKMKLDDTGIDKHLGVPLAVEETSKALFDGTTTDQSTEVAVVKAETKPIPDHDSHQLAEREKPSFTESKKPPVTQSAKSSAIEAEKLVIIEAEKPSIMDIKKPIVAEPEKAKITEPEIQNTAEPVIVQQAVVEHHEEKKHKMNSYWNITEINKFPEFLREFGTDWNMIAAKLGTKTPTMIRNYYQRNAELHGWAIVPSGKVSGIATHVSSDSKPLDEMAVNFKPKPTQDSHNANTTAPSSKSGVPSFTGKPKSSIMSLLNDDPPERKEIKEQLQTPRVNNLSSLLNASSTVTNPGAARELHVTKSTIESLLD